MLVAGDASNVELAWLLSSPGHLMSSFRSEWPFPPPHVFASPTPFSVSLLISLPYRHLLTQMPRGNLEVAAPRALTLASARLLMDRCVCKFFCNVLFIIVCIPLSRKYGAAMELLRKHRIDLNFLWDHDPAALSSWIHVAASQALALLTLSFCL